MSTRTIACTLLLLSACTVENLGSIEAPQHSVFGEPRWIISLGGVEYDRSMAVATDPAGDVIAGGHFGATVDFGNGTVTAANSAGWISKRSAMDGHALWTITFGTEPTARGAVAGVAVDTAGNIFVLGGYAGTTQVHGHVLSSGGLTNSGGGFIAKYTPGGSLVWLRDLAFLGTAHSPGEIALGHDGRIAIAGNYRGSIQFPNGTFSVSTRGAYVAVLDENGNALWGAVGSDDTWITNLEVTPESDVILNGFMNQRSTFAGHPLDALALSTQFAARMTATGTALWVRVIGAAGEIRTSAGVVEDPAGNTFTVSSLQTDDADTMTAKATIDALDPNGQSLWSRQLASTAYAYFATRSASGAIITGGHVLYSLPGPTGYRADFGLGPRDGHMFLVAHDGNGNLIDHTTVLGACTGLFFRAAPSASNGLVMVGSQQNRIGGLPTCYRDAGDADALLMMLDMQ